MKFSVIFARSVRCPGRKEIQPRAAHTVVKVRGGKCYSSSGLDFPLLSSFFCFSTSIFSSSEFLLIVDPFKSKVGYSSLFGASLTNAGQVVIRLTGRIHANLAILMSSQLKRGCERVGAASRQKRLDRDEARFLSGRNGGTQNEADLVVVVAGGCSK